MSVREQERRQREATYRVNGAGFLTVEISPVEHDLFCFSRLEV
jgi:hypothetical protein